MKRNKPIASLSLDLDNKWSYLMTHGEPGWKSFPSYLDILIPRVLNFLKTKNLNITFFIVGQDAALKDNREILKSIAEAGHEIGNHSFKHEPWLHLYSEKEIGKEIETAEEYIEQATGQRPIGFRGPGFSLSTATLRELARRGYLYDASTFPTFVGPLAKIYYFLTAQFTAEEKQQRSLFGGSFREGLRPIKPYRWQMGSSSLIEIPVTTMPFLRFPFHLSYILWLSIFSKTLAKQYFEMVLILCRLTGTQLSLLLHPTDFLGCDDTRDLSFFPGMSLPSGKKLELLNHVLKRLTEEFTILTLQKHAQVASCNCKLPEYKASLLN